MNPAILGALIGALSGTAAAALTAWNSVRISKLNQTGEHAQWLRDRRAALYVELLAYQRVLEARRRKLIKSDSPADAVREAIGYAHAPENESEAELVSRMIAYASKEVWKAYYEATAAEISVWDVAAEEITRLKATTLVITEKLANAVDEADVKSSNFLNAVHRDMQVLGPV